MLDRLRSRLDSGLLRLGTGAARILPSPTAWTLIGVLFALFAAGGFALGSRLGEVLGGGGIILSGFFDVVDGAVARATGRTSKRGSFLDSTLDRIAEFFLYLGMIIGGLVAPLPVFLALSLSLLVSYTRAKGDSLGYSLAGVGVGERSERLIVLAISAILGLLFYGAVIVILLAAFTFAERVYKITRSLS